MRGYDKTADSDSVIAHLKVGISAMKTQNYPTIRSLPRQTIIDGSVPAHSSVGYVQVINVMMREGSLATA